MLTNEDTKLSFIIFEEEYGVQLAASGLTCTFIHKIDF